MSYMLWITLKVLLFPILFPCWLFIVLVITVFFSIWSLHIWAIVGDKQRAKDIFRMMVLESWNPKLWTGILWRW